VASTPVGTTAPVKIFRDRKEMTLSVVVGRRPGSEPEKPAELVAARNTEDETQKTSGIGIRIQTLNSQLIRDKEQDVRTGVTVLRVDSGSAADDARLKVGDVIETINRQLIKNNEDFKRVIGQLKSGDPIVLQVYRERLMPTPRIFISFNKP